MKIGVINFSGNVGKTTIARHLLEPRMEDANVIAIETINSDENEGAVVKGKQFGELQEALLVMGDAVVDIGASNVEEYIGLMEQYKGSYEDYDLFVVPTVPNKKQQRDTISTIAALADIGVSPEKIRLVFNMVEVDDDLEKVFEGLFNYHASKKSFKLNPKAVIRSNEIYSKINGTNQTISGILEDRTDYKAKIHEAKNQEEKGGLARLLSVQRLAAGVKGELDSVFTQITK